MPRRKDISSYLREAISAAHQSGKSYKVTSEQFVVHPSTMAEKVHKRKTIKTVASFPRSGRPSKITPRSDCEMLRETANTQEIHLRLYRPQLAC